MRTIVLTSADLNKTKAEIIAALSPTHTAQFIVDPSHAWLVVETSALTELGIENEISSYSYRNGTKVYLEEDSDAPKFIRAMAAKGIKVITEDRYTDSPSRVRGYAPYAAKAKG